MNPSEYTYAVACIRSNETKLLSAQELNSVINAAGYREAVRRLNDRGYEIAGSDYAAALEKRLSDAWGLLETLLPDRSQFDSILIENDFQNLKSAVKALVCDKEAGSLLFAPSVYDADLIVDAVNRNDNDSLPEPLRHAHRSSYRILTQTRFAQLADSVVDRAALEWSIKLADQADHPIMRQIAQTRAACADIKILYRCIKAQKAQSFTERCVCACDAFDKAEIIAVSQQGRDAFLEYLSHTDYADAAVALRESPSAFEKWCDDKMLSLLRPAKFDIGGPAPLAAYWFAVQAEVKDIRIILSAKHSGIPDEIVRGRVRELYV
ncbi:MAG: V-type ATPase subunit [Clostridia bacterium]|nr:V-type ATPase subunit [Clostridia bacterium]